MATRNCFACYPGPKTSLEQWREDSCCIDGFGFWGLDCGGDCTDIVVEDLTAAREIGFMGRRQIADAIARAEQILCDSLGYSVVPMWMTEIVDLTHCGTVAKLSKGDLVHVGQPTENYIETFDVDYLTVFRGDCIDEFEIEIDLSLLTDDQQTALTACEDIELRIPKEFLHRSDCEGTYWSKVSGLCVEREDGIIRLSGAAWQLVRPLLRMRMFNSLDQYPIDATDPDNFVPRLEVWCNGVDLCAGLKGLVRHNSCKCEQPECNECWEEIDMTACIESYRSGIISVRAAPTCDGDCHCCKCRIPEKLCVTYLSYNCDKDWSNEIFALSVAELCHPICGCEHACIKRHQHDIAHMASPNSGTRTATFDQLENPLGTLTGHATAWNSIRRYKRRGIVRI